MSSFASPPQSAEALSPDTAGDRLDRVGVLFLFAACAWLGGSIVGISFAKADNLSDGFSFIASEALFYAAMVALVAAFLQARRTGLVGGSKAGRVGLLLAAIGWTAIMVGGLLINFAGIEAAGLLMLLAHTTFTVGEIMAGVAILRHGPLPKPGAAVLLVAGITSSVAWMVTMAFGGASNGPGHAAELAQLSQWALIALSILRPSAGRSWFALSLVAAGVAVISPFIAF